MKIKNKWHHLSGFHLVATLAISLGMGVCFAWAAAPNFKDVPRTSPYFLAVKYLSEAEIVKGYEDGTFGPEKPINRAEVLKIILGGSEIAVKNPDGKEVPFPDVKPEDWFAPYAMTGSELKIVAGNDADRSFSPGRQVNKAEFIKMLLIANRVNIEAFQGKESAFQDVPKDAWFSPYLNYAATIGIIAPESEGFINPSKPLTRAEVAETMYLLTLIKKATDTQFLLDHTENQLAQIEVYIAANRVDLAKRASGLGVDLSQQALKNMPQSNVVLGAAKLAKAYSFLVASYEAGIQRKNEEASSLANQAILKATEAWEANNATQPIAKHIKDRAREILAQVGGTETKITTTPEPAGN